MPDAPRIFQRFANLLDIAVTRGAAVWARLNADGTVDQRTAAQTRGDLGAAASGANTDITSITSTTALTLAAGGTNQDVVIQTTGTGVTKILNASGLGVLRVESNTNPDIEFVKGNPGDYATFSWYTGTSYSKTRQFLLSHFNDNTLRLTHNGGSFNDLVLHQSGGISLGSSTDPGTGALASGTIVTGAYTFGTLPTPVIGMRAMITDCGSSAFNDIASSGGGATVPVFYDGTEWRIG